MILHANDVYNESEKLKLNLTEFRFICLIASYMCTSRLQYNVDAVKMLICMNRHTIITSIVKLGQLCAYNIIYYRIHIKMVLKLKLSKF